MKLPRKTFSFLVFFILCCSALFLLILTVIGILLGIYSLFLEEPELNGIIFPKTTKQLATETIIWCIWILGFGISFIVNILILYRNIRNIK